MALKSQQWINCNQQGAGRYIKQKQFYGQNQFDNRGGANQGRGRGFNNRGFRGGFNNRGNDRGNFNRYNQGFNRTNQGGDNTMSQNYKTVKCKFFEQSKF